MGHRGVSEDLAAGGGQHVHRARGGHARGHRRGVRHQDGQGRGSHRSVADCCFGGSVVRMVYFGAISVLYILFFTKELYFQLASTATLTRLCPWTACAR